jgi:capsular polysaccharide biosynthesis protein
MTFTKLINVQFVENLTAYPDPKIYSFYNNKYDFPVKEKIMSLSSVTLNKDNTTLKKHKNTEKTPLFYFIYNFDNYYHFVYDTLPYLITYSELKKEYPNLKLLVNYPKGTTKFNTFVLEFFELLNIFSSDLILVNDSTIYETLFVSKSYTNNELQIPDNKIYDFFSNMIQDVKIDKSNSKKIYVSRRSHIHGNYNNIGTDYTQRRKLINEDSLVDFLVKNGYTEVFTELLSTTEKIKLFKNCSHVIGPIGGGLCNVLFSQKETKLLCIVSPEFLTVNGRFVHSFKNVTTKYFFDCSHSNTEKLKKNMRVRVLTKDVVGEIIEIFDDEVLVMFSYDNLAGWNSKVNYETLLVNKSSICPLDNGLNSEWKINLETFKEVFFNYEC